MNEQILTLNPDPNKKGVKVDKAHYDFVRAEILKAIKKEGPLASMQLVDVMIRRLGKDKTFGKSIGWYTMAVHLDLESKGELLYDRKAKKPVLSLP